MWALQRMNELCELARKRIEVAAHTPGIQYAEILWLTPEEASEFMQLRLSLPSFGQLAYEARSRIICKIVKRRMREFSTRI
jgi:hypothetical protein